MSLLLLSLTFPLALWSNPHGGMQYVEDNGDSFMSIAIVVGDQELKVIPDTGSFDIYLIDGEACNSDLCAKAYDPSKSSTHGAPADYLFKDILFGSGAAKAKLGFDHVQVRDDSRSQSVSAVEADALKPVLIPLWEIVGLSESLTMVWGDGRGFQGILGVGFNGNSDKSESETVKEEEAAMEAVLAGRNDSSRAALPGQGSPALFSNQFALCMPKGEAANSLQMLERSKFKKSKTTLETESSSPGEGGILWWGSSIPSKGLSWGKAEVVGTRHWAVGMMDVTIGHDKDRSIKFCNEKHPCAALVDSGTSLLALPRRRIEAILSKTAVADLEDDCSNLDQMPDIEMKLGSASIVLTPETYIMKVEANEEDLETLVSNTPDNLFLRLQRPLERLRRRNSELRARNDSVSLLAVKDTILMCTPAFMRSPIERAVIGKKGVSMVEGPRSKEHEVWVLGIPLFREYTVKFDRRGELMEFAKHDTDDCEPSPTAPTLRKSSYLSTVARAKRIRTLPPLSKLVYPGNTEVTGVRGASVGQGVGELNALAVGPGFVL